MKKYVKYIGIFLIYFLSEIFCFSKISFAQNLACIDLKDRDAFEKILEDNKTLRFSENHCFVDSVPKLRNHFLKGSLELTFKEGIYYLDKSLVIDWADRLTFSGVSESLEFIDIQTSPGDEGAWNIYLRVKHARGARPGYFIRITNVKGKGAPEAFSGAWEIISLENHVLTLKHTGRFTRFPAAVVSTAKIELIKTVFIANDQTVLQLHGGIFHSDAIVYKVEGARRKDGTKAVSVAPRSGSKVGRHSLASAFFGSRTAFTGAGNHGLVVGGNSFVELSPMVAACGNFQDGFHATEGGNIFAKFVVAVGNGESGVMAEFQGGVEADGIIAIGNGGDGVEAAGGGNIGISQDRSYLAYNERNGATVSKGGLLRGSGASFLFNRKAGVKVDAGSVAVVPRSIAASNGDAGFHAVGLSYMDARHSSSSLNRIGYFSDLNSIIVATGEATNEGNALGYKETRGGQVLTNENRLEHFAAGKREGATGFFYSRDGDKVIVKDGLIKRIEKSKSP